MAAVFILAVPGLASAAFTASASAGSGLQVGTYLIPAPGAYTASRTCIASPRSIRITATSFPAVAKATSYVATVTAPDGTSSATTVTPAAGYNITKTSTTGGTYSIALVANVGNWTGPALTKTFVCN